MIEDKEDNNYIQLNTMDFIANFSRKRLGLMLLMLLLFFGLMAPLVRAGPIAGALCANCLAVNCANAAYMCYPLAGTPAFVVCVISNASWQAYISCLPVCGATIIPIP